MKRFLLPLALALSVHGLVLKMDVPWFEPPKRREARPLAVSLTTRPALQRREPLPPPSRPSQKPTPTPPPAAPSPSAAKRAPRKAPEPAAPPLRKAPAPAHAAKRGATVNKPRPRARAVSPKPQARPAKKSSPAPSPRNPAAKPDMQDRHPKPARSKTPRRAPVSSSSSKTRAAVSEPSPAPPPRQVLPAYRRNPPPVYPASARRRGYEGTVILEVLVNARGTVDELRVSRSSGFKVLDRAALRAVKIWLFEPGRQGERAVAMWVKVPVRFQLQKDRG